jgi:hypothetical protein
MNSKALCGAVFLPLSLSAVAAANTMTFGPVQWNTLIQSTSAANQLSNGQGDIYVGRTNQDLNGPATISIRRGLIEFNIAGSIPADATITGGSLTMCDIMGSNGNQTISLYDVLQAWGQGTSNTGNTNGAMGASPTNNDATWLYTVYDAANPALSSTWSLPGGYFSATLSGSATDNVAAGGLVTWSSPQMVSDVQNWLNNPSDNFGWLMKGNESTGKTAKQYESDLSNDSEGCVPELTIQYTIPVPEPSSAVIAGAGMVLAGGYAAVRGRVAGGGARWETRDER